jgi:hypothetical protein
MEAGFQLSFSAVLGLVWYFGNVKYTKLSVSQRIARIVGATVMTTIIATIFTMPFIASHFHTIPIYSLIGNLVLLPIFSFVVMPLVLIGTATALFGFTMMLDWANNVYDFALIIATKIAELPYAQLAIPSISQFALVSMTIGLLCLILIRDKNKLLFALFIRIGIFDIAIQSRPLFYATGDHELVGFVKDDRKLEFNKSRASNHYFAFDNWKQLNYEPTGTPNPRRKCKNGLCIYKTENWNLAYMQKFMPTYKNIVELCRDKNIDFIVSYFDIHAPKCYAKIINGGFVIYKNGDIKYTPANRIWH